MPRCAVRMFEIRNAKGQYIGSYTAKSAEAAIKKAESEINAQCGAFRKSMARVSLLDCTATEIQPA